MSTSSRTSSNPSSTTHSYVDHLLILQRQRQDFPTLSRRFSSRLCCRRRALYPRRTVRRTWRYGRSHRPYVAGLLARCCNELTSFLRRAPLPLPPPSFDISRLPRLSAHGLPRRLPRSPPARPLQQDHFGRNGYRRSSSAQAYRGEEDRVDASPGGTVWRIGRR